MKTNAIKKWMIDHGVYHWMIAREAGCCRAEVTNVIGGVRKKGPAAQAVKDVLCFLGCPKRYLAD
jgi:hypothetical protein